MLPMRPTPNWKSSPLMCGWFPRGVLTRMSGESASMALSLGQLLKERGGSTEPMTGTTGGSGMRSVQGPHSVTAPSFLPEQGQSLEAEGPSSLGPIVVDDSGPDPHGTRAGVGECSLQGQILSPNLHCPDMSSDPGQIMRRSTIQQDHFGHTCSPLCLLVEKPECTGVPCPAKPPQTHEHECVDSTGKTACGS